MKKFFITDCEGPISLNDNAFELCDNFISDGDKFFKVVSAFDDYLVDIVKKENYNAGDTLKLISPFLKIYGLTNERILNFSKENIFLVDGSKDTMDLAKKYIDSYIVSTSYMQYIEALSDYIDFPFENTYYTKLDLSILDNKLNNSLNETNNNLNEDFFKILEKEKEILNSFKEKIVKIDPNQIEENFTFLDKIFFNEIPKLNIYKIVENVKTVGGLGKQLAIEDIISKNLLNGNKFNKNVFNENKIQIMYIGDSITDLEPLRFTNENNGIAISFNGNEYSIKEANIAIISTNTITNSLLIDLHIHFNKDYIFEFVRAYNKDPNYAFDNFRVSYKLVDKFKEIFKNQELPIIKLVTEDNIDELIEKSKKLRKEIRGKAIGALG